MTSTDHPIRCKCGRLTGVLAQAASGTRGTCYCRDCQAFAHALGNPEATLDHLGGTDLVATMQKHVSFTHGAESLACLSLSEGGLLRWYASCCNTPIANTARNPKISYVGLVHTCLGPSQHALDAVFGPNSMPINVKHAKAPVAANTLKAIPFLARTFGSIALARLTGTYRQTPFFVEPLGTPVVTPRVLSAAEHERAMSAV